jgi:hypothetical protein
LDTKNFQEPPTYEFSDEALVAEYRKGLPYVGRTWLARLGALFSKTSQSSMHQ